MAYRPSLRRWARSVGRLFRASGGASKRTKRFTSALGEFVLDTLLLPFAIVDYCRERKKGGRYDYESVEIPLNETPDDRQDGKKTAKNEYTGTKYRKSGYSTREGREAYESRDEQGAASEKTEENIPVLEAKSIHINIASPRGNKSDGKS